MSSAKSRPRPVVLVIAGHDPTGGAGIQADIRSVAALGGHAVTLVTALTAQDTCRVTDLFPVDPGALQRQAEVLLADIQVDVVKIGLLASESVVSVVGTLLEQMVGTPVVLDPVLAAGGGGAEAGSRLIATMQEQLFPRVTLLTPNTVEAGRLTEASGADAQAARLLATGCQHVLLTGTHDATGEEVVNRLYGQNQSVSCMTWPRLPGSYHGSGCTLASACAVLLGGGREVADAVAEAQRYTWSALASGFALGGGQMIPGVAPDRQTIAQNKR